MGIKKEKSNDQVTASDAVGFDNSLAFAWTAEKKNLIDEMVTLKSENQVITRKLHEKDIELLSQCKSHQALEVLIKEQELAWSSKKNELKTQLQDANEKNNTNQKTISNLMRENQLLVSKNKQLQAALVPTEDVNLNTDDSDLFEVETLIENKVVNENHFLVRWKGFDSTHDSWERESNLSCPHILKKYKKLKKML